MQWIEDEELCTSLETFLFAKGKYIAVVRKVDTGNGKHGQTF